MTAPANTISVSQNETKIFQNSRFMFGSAGTGSNDAPLSGRGGMHEACRSEACPVLTR